jgi:hypothetical protein
LKQYQFKKTIKPNKLYYKTTRFICLNNKIMMLFIFKMIVKVKYNTILNLLQKVISQDANAKYKINFIIFTLLIKNNNNLKNYKNC